MLTTHRKKTPVIQTKAPTFSGVGDLVVKTMGAFEKSPSVELMTTDLMGMTLPRTAIEAKERGSDMARETFLREIFSLSSQVIMPPLIALGMVKSAKLLPFMQQQVPLRAWISGNMLYGFGTLYEQSLSQAKTPKEARTHFIKSVLKNLQATDTHVPTKVVPFLLENTLGQVKAKKFLKKQAEPYHQNKLTNIEELLPLFERKDKKSEGIYKLEENVRSVIQKAKIENPKLSPKQLKKLEWQTRKDLVQSILPVEKPFLKDLTEKAIAGGLNEKVHLLDHEDTILVKNRKLASTLKQLKYFLEHYVDRVCVTSTGYIEKPLDSLLHANNQETVKMHIQNKLFSNAHHQQGLIRRSLKSTKWVAGGAAVIAGIYGASQAFINNWLTKKLHHGRVYFPGESTDANIKIKETMPIEITTHNNEKYHGLFIPHAGIPPFPSPKFGHHPPLPKVGKLLQAFDLEQLTRTPLNHFKLNYGLVVGARVPASIQRGRKNHSWNETREIVSRDAPGWLTWFYVTPLGHRLLTRFIMPKDIRTHLIGSFRNKPKPTNGTLWERAKWEVNTLLRGQLPSKVQIQHRMQQTLTALEAQKKSLSITKEDIQKIESLFKRMVKWRSYAMATGMAMTTLTLGVGIMYLNIYLTRRNIEKQKRTLAQSASPSNSLPLKNESRYARGTMSLQPQVTYPYQTVQAQPQYYQQQQPR